MALSEQYSQYSQTHEDVIKRSLTVSSLVLPTTETNDSVNQVSKARQDQDELKMDKGGLDRRQKLGLLAVALLSIISGAAIAILVLFAKKSSGSGSPTTHSTNTKNINEIVQSKRLLQKSDTPTETPSISPTTFSPTTTIAPSTVPSTSSSPSNSPSYYPTMAPTVPVLGCRGDRFDNEGNRQKNNRLFAGQYVCSDDDDQRYWFGLDSTTGNLIWKDTQTDQLKTYYFNDYGYPEEEETKSNDDITNNKEPTVLDYYFSISTEAAFRVHRVQRTEEYQIVEESLHWELPSTYNVSIVYKDCLFTHDCPYMHLHHDGVMVLAWLDFALSKWYVLAFFFCISVCGYFRIRKAHSPSFFLHIFYLSFVSFYIRIDGWMEKNIKRCYNFNTTDKL